jgi:hypothetical protein
MFYFIVIDSANNLRCRNAKNKIHRHEHSVGVADVTFQRKVTYLDMRRLPTLAFR